MYVYIESETAQETGSYPLARVFWLDTEGGEPGDGAWYWVRLDASGEPAGESEGPFESASAAVRSAAYYDAQFDEQTGTITG